MWVVAISYFFDGEMYGDVFYGVTETECVQHVVRYALAENLVRLDDVFDLDQFEGEYVPKKLLAQARIDAPKGFTTRAQLDVCLEKLFVPFKVIWKELH